MIAYFLCYLNYISVLCTSALKKKKHAKTTVYITLWPICEEPKTNVMNNHKVHGKCLTAVS